MPTGKRAQDHPGSATSGQGAARESSGASPSEPVPRPLPPLTRSSREHASRKLRSGTQLPDTGGGDDEAARAVLVRIPSFGPATSSEIVPLRRPSPRPVATSAPQSPRSHPATAKSPRSRPRSAGDSTCQQPVSNDLEPTSFDRMHPRWPRSAMSPSRQPVSPSDRMTRADAEAQQRSQESLAQQAEHWQHEEAVLARAREISERQAGKLLPMFPEPKRPKTHWDYVLEEMQWMAKEFAKERRWKLAQSKRFARLISRSNLDIESRKLQQQKDEALKIRRRAAWIGKEVLRFWNKAERLVFFKQQSQVEAKKKEVLDKHLDFLVGQTQRYSSLLAQRLGPEQAKGKEATEASAPSADVVMAECEDGDAEFQADQSSEEDDEATLDEEEALAGGDASARQAEELAGLEDEADMPLEQLLARYGFVQTTEEGGPAEQQDDTAERASRQAGSPSSPPADLSDLASASSGASEGAHVTSVAEGELARPSAAAKGRAEGEAGDTEYTALDSDVDDEATLDEEEQLAAAEGRNLQDDTRAEVAALNDEADLPLDELLARFGFIREGADPEPARDAAGLSTAQQPAAPAPEPVLRKREVLGKQDGRERLEGVARLANDMQPTGYTLSTTNVRTKVPFLLKNTLREYQHIGLDWLVTIYMRRLNGILADEMGLGKTIMTIALIAHLACEQGIWGPHLIVVPTSVMLNWEMEFKKWCPAFKLLTYFGSAKERKLKRQGWSKPNAFHVCITSYTLVLQDAKMFRRKKWKYLILDEAHMIKNWKSQRWQTLLNFNSKRRLLITGTPLQNDLMELWSLMHFLMPQVFASHQQFKDWFSNPLTGMVEGQETVNKELVERLHGVLRPFLLRRLKTDVEKQLPQKHMHVVRCRLSKRQRTLYEDYMASSDTRATLASGNFLGIINVLMQLRKVCNHPDMFEGRPIVSAFDMAGLELQLPSPAFRVLEPHLWQGHEWAALGLMPAALTGRAAWEAKTVEVLAASPSMLQALPHWQPASHKSLQASLGFQPSRPTLALIAQFQQDLAALRAEEAAKRAQRDAASSFLRCQLAPVYGRDLIRAVTIEQPISQVHVTASQRGRHLDFSSVLASMILTPAQRAEHIEDLLRGFMFVIPKARAPPPSIWCSCPDPVTVAAAAERAHIAAQEFFARSAPLRTAIVRQQLFFPDRRLLQFDCGKLQELAVLLRRLKQGSHKALIFTQMTKMLDILEAFLNLHGYTYLRLDGSTKPEQRQVLMQRFNTNPKIFVFILSTRSGGVGMNLTGADTVIFYDSDWNPAMDAQAQDRCHRIGQTREVHIYRLISEKTIEENILQKSDQKRQLDFLAIQSGGFNTDILQKFDPRSVFGGGGGPSAEEVQAAMRSVEDENDAAAAAALEQETAAELAEFNAEAGPGLADAEAGEADAEDDEAEADEAREAPASSGAGAPGAVVAADEDEMMADVAELLGQANAKGGMAQLEDSLRPIEKYAVRFLERMQEVQDVEAAAAGVAAELDAQEWNMNELERIQAEQEAEMDEEGEAQRLAEWDTAAADAAYRAQVERARALAQEQRDHQELEASAVDGETDANTDAGWDMKGIKRKEKAGKNGRAGQWSGRDNGEESTAAEPGFWRTYKTSRKRRRLEEEAGRRASAPRWRWAGEAEGSSEEDVQVSSSEEDAVSPRLEGGDEGGGPSSRRRSSAAYASGKRQRSNAYGTPRRESWPNADDDADEDEYHTGDLDNGPPSQAVSRAASPEAGTGEWRGAAAAISVEEAQQLMRAPHHIWQPWEVTEDLVLVALARQALAASPGGSLAPAIWQLASDALAAGANALSAAAASNALQQGRKRSAAACQQRYQMLVAARKGAKAGGVATPHDLASLRAQLVALMDGNSAASFQVLTSSITRAAAVHNPHGQFGAGSMTQAHQLLQEIEALVKGGAAVNGSLPTQNGADTSAGGVAAANHALAGITGPSQQLDIPALQSLLTQLQRQALCIREGKQDSPYLSDVFLRPPTHKGQQCGRGRLFAAAGRPQHANMAPLDMTVSEAFGPRGVALVGMKEQEVHHLRDWFAQMEPGFVVSCCSSNMLKLEAGAALYTSDGSMREEPYRQALPPPRVAIFSGLTNAEVVGVIQFWTDATEVPEPAFVTMLPAMVNTILQKVVTDAARTRALSEGSARKLSPEEFGQP
ncbi:hypothetical protein WJX72_002805 [[Myrmecia] bisecta]|uniref:Uncharacterized protein n=1 Tax=[Myrmecia] bisecta TaxID=41462 RepID=A0AAW1P8R0_9CHLO